MTSQAELDLIFLCNLFGACIKRSQGAGGNISVKDGGKLYIKASGVRLSSVKKGYGYVICDISGIEKCYNNSEEDLQSTLIVTTTQKPSMEAFFHLLPAKYVVHFHSTYICKFLCSNKANKLFTKEQFPSSLYIPYVKPGLELAKNILSVYTTETILFLESHGIILLGNSIESIVMLYKNICIQLQELTGCLDIFSRIEIEYTLQKITKLTCKPLYNLLQDLPSSFLPITPDHFLFLQEAPLLTTSEKVEFDLQKWSHMNGKPPSVISVNNQVYVLGNTLEECQNKEDYLLSYLEIKDDTSKSISMKDMQNLLQCPKEQFRLRLM